MKRRKADYYEVLGVDKTADLRAIRSAYRKLARRYHPDVAKVHDAAPQFLLIQEAYETLSDPARRRQYDRTRPPARPPNRAKTSSLSSRVKRDESGIAVNILGISVSFGWQANLLSDDE